MTPLPTWSPEQVLALAPDASSAKAGRDLSAPRKWLTMHNATTTLWGTCQGSAKDPYRTIIDLSEPAFSCTCPSRKFPCKHALGLFLIFAQNQTAFEAKDSPDWVQKWLASRTARAEKQVERAEKKRDELADPEAQAKRIAQRQARITAGLDDLERWLHDLIRRGLAHAQTQTHNYWATQASRLVDAQAPGLANMLLELSGLPSSGADWETRLLARLAQLHLLIEAYRHCDTLAPENQADVRTAVGWTLNQDEILACDGTRADWLVLGKRITEEGALRVQRSWLWANQQRRAALVLHFAAGNQPLDASLVSGSVFDGELVFYPSAAPQRALLKQRHGATQSIDAIQGHANLTAAMRAYAQDLALQPWLRQGLFVVNALTPVCEGDHWAVRDAEGRAVAIAETFASIWQLIALSGGNPITLTGEWDGAELMPLSAWADGRFIHF